MDQQVEDLQTHDVSRCVSIMKLWEKWTVANTNAFMVVHYHNEEWLQEFLATIEKTEPTCILVSREIAFEVHKHTEGQHYHFMVNYPEGTNVDNIWRNCKENILKKKYKLKGQGGNGKGKEFGKENKDFRDITDFIRYIIKDNNYDIYLKNQDDLKELQRQINELPPWQETLTPDKQKEAVFKSCMTHLQGIKHIDDPIRYNRRPNAIIVDTVDERIFVEIYTHIKEKGFNIPAPSTIDTIARTFKFKYLKSFSMLDYIRQYHKIPHSFI